MPLLSHLTMLSPTSTTIDNVIVITTGPIDVTNFEFLEKLIRNSFSIVM